MPRVLGRGIIDHREYLIVEKLPGYMLESFTGQPPELLYCLGVGLAQIHGYRQKYAGNPLGTIRVAAEDFHTHQESSLQCFIGVRLCGNRHHLHLVMVPSLSYIIVGKPGSIVCPVQVKA